MSPILSSGSCLSHVSSQVATTIARYFASGVDLTTIFCFLLPHEIRFSMIRSQDPEVDLLSVGHLVQSASE